jgi:hypothetical protein
MYIKLSVFVPDALLLGFACLPLLLNTSFKMNDKTVIILTSIPNYRRAMDYGYEKEMRDHQMPSRMAHGAWLGATSSLHTPLFTGVRGTGNGKP